jgi:hypothetical protein
VAILGWEWARAGVTGINQVANALNGRARLAGRASIIREASVARPTEASILKPTGLIPNLTVICGTEPIMSRKISEAKHKKKNEKLK